MSGKCDYCGICCVALSITSLNKPAGVRCRYLKDNLCSVWNTDLQPSVCRTIVPMNDLCRFDMRGTPRAHYKYLLSLERSTTP